MRNDGLHPQSIEDNVDTLATVCVRFLFGVFGGVMFTIIKLLNRPKNEYAFLVYLRSTLCVVWGGCQKRC